MMNNKNVNNKTLCIKCLINTKITSILGRMEKV